MTAILILIVVPTSMETFVISWNKLLHSLLMEVCVLQFQPCCHVIMTLKFA